MFKLILIVFFSCLSFQSQATGLIESSLTSVHSLLAGMISFFTPIFMLIGAGLIFMTFLSHERASPDCFISGGCLLISPAVFKALISGLDDGEEIKQPVSLWENITHNFSFSTILFICVVIVSIIIISIIYTLKTRHSKFLILQRQREKDLSLLSKVSDLYIIHYDLITKKHTEFKDIMKNIRSEKRKFDNNEEHTLKNRNTEKFNKFLQAALTTFNSSASSPLNLKK